MPERKKWTHSNLNVESWSDDDEDAKDGEDHAQVEQQDRDLARLRTLTRPLTWQDKGRIKISGPTSLLKIWQMVSLDPSIS